MSNVVKITNSPGSNNSFFVPVGYVVNARRIADRRVILAGYGLADLLMRIVGNSGTAITRDEIERLGNQQEKLIGKLAGTATDIRF